MKSLLESLNESMSEKFVFFPDVEETRDQIADILYITPDEIDTIAGWYMDLKVNGKDARLEQRDLDTPDLVFVYNTIETVFNDQDSYETALKKLGIRLGAKAIVTNYGTL